MKITGIIAEYNPFHSGHAYHIQRTRELSGCDYVVVCMSSSFTQRGEPACLPARERARAALMNGADAVFGLPALWAVRTADAFARGGIAILGGLGCDLLSFGTETADLSLIDRLADLRENEPPELSAAIRSALNDGKSHARARGEALAACLGVSPETLNAPNLVLALEYIRAMRALYPSMQPLPILREGAYHDTVPSRFASAAAIRKGISDGDDSVLRYVPEAEAQALRSEPVRAMDDILLYRLRTMTPEQYADLPDITEGLDHRLMNSAAHCTSREQLIADIKCKRYTYARVSRLCAHALLGVTSEMTERIQLPPYARLIGVRRDALPLLKELNARTRIPLCSETRSIRNNEVFRLETRAADIRGILSSPPQPANALLTEKFLMV